MHVPAHHRGRRLAAPPIGGHVLAASHTPGALRLMRRGYRIITRVLRARKKETP